MALNGLIDLVKSCGYDNNPDFPQNPEINWAFEFPQTKPLLHYIMNNLSNENFLSFEEMKMFQKLVEMNKVLEGEELNKALYRINSLQQQEPIESIKDQISSLSSSIVISNQELANHIQQRDLLSSHHNQRKQYLHTIQSKTRQLPSLTQSLDQNFYIRNHKWNELLKSIRKNVHELLATHPSSTNLLSSSDLFLSSIDHSQYQLLDELFLKSLKSYYSKQFHPQFLTSICNFSSEIYHWFSLDDDNNGKPQYLVDDNRQKEYEYCYRHLSRLKKDYRLIHQQWIESQLFSTTLSSQIETITNQIQNIQSYLNHPDSFLKTNISQFSISMMDIRKKTDVLKNDALSLLIPLSSLNTTGILASDYDIQLARQDYLLSKQHLILNFLSQHLSIHQTFSFLLSRELTSHQKFHSFLISYLNKLQSLALGFQERETCLKTAKPASSVWFRRLYQLLSIYSPSYGDILDNWDDMLACVYKWQEHFTKSQLQQTSKEDETHHLFQSIKQYVDKLSQILSSVTETSLTPIPIARLFQSLDQKIKQFTAQMEILLKKQHNEQERFQRYIEENTFRRMIWILFLLHPSKLKDKIAKLQTRYEAQQISL